MISRRGHIVRASIVRVPAFAMAFAAALVACASSPVIGPALAQETRPPAELAPSSAQPAPGPPSKQEGVMDTVGRWLEEGADRFKSHMQNAQEQLDKLARETRESTRDATTAVVGLPNARIVEASEPCVLAQNGAPDCQATALALCRAKGFAAGKSLDTRNRAEVQIRALPARGPRSHDLRVPDPDLSRARDVPVMGCRRPAEIEGQP